MGTGAVLALPPSADIPLSSSPLACSAPGDCVIVGSFRHYANEVPLVMTETDGNWGAAQMLLPPANARTTEDSMAHLTSVACVPSGPCLAVGSYLTNPRNEEPMIAVESGGSWGATHELVPSLAGWTGKASPEGQLSSASCLPSGSCVALGWVWTEEGQSGYRAPATVSDASGSWKWEWVDKEEAEGQARYLEALACWSPGSCAAVGTYTHAGPCPSEPEGICKFEEVPIAAIQTAERWEPPWQVLPEGGLRSVSCAPEGPCAAAGHYRGSQTDAPIVATGAELGGALQIQPPENAESGGGARLESVSCPPVGPCVAVGSYRADNGSDEAMAVSGGGVEMHPQGPAVLLRNRVIRVRRNGKAAIRLSCLTPGNCMGTLMLTAKGEQAGRQTEIAFAHFFAPTGRVRTTRIRLRRAGRALLVARHGRFPARLTIDKTFPAPARVEVHKVRLRQHGTARR
jgi:hypothetical protein